jgi:lysophospholipase L1-like esterase
LKGVGDVPELMQPDAIHPNATAQALLEKKVLDAVTPLLKLKHPVSSQKKEKP